MRRPRGPYGPKQHRARTRTCGVCGGDLVVRFTQERTAFQPGGAPETVLVRVRKCDACDNETTSVERDVAAAATPLVFNRAEAVLA